MTLFPRVSSGTGMTIKRATLNSGATINTIFREFCGGIYRSPMNGRMAFMANRQPIINVKTQLWEIRERFDMMSLEKFPTVSAFLTSITIFHKNCLSPDSQTISGDGTIPIKAHTSLPMPRHASAKVSGSIFSSTGTGTKFRSAVCGSERFFTPLADFNRWRIANRPTILRAIFGSFCSIKRSLKDFTAYNTSLLNGSLFHNNTSTYHNIKPQYCGVKVYQKWEKFTGNKREKVNGVNT
jgi:hypothetical protein